MWQARAHRAGFGIVRKLTPKKSATSRVVGLCGKGCAACFVSSRPKTISTPCSQKKATTKHHRLLVVLPFLKLLSGMTLHDKRFTETCVFFHFRRFRTLTISQGK